MCSSVACSYVTQNRMTYFPRTIDGIMWNLPEWLIRAKNSRFTESEFLFKQKRRRRKKKNVNYSWMLKKQFRWSQCCAFCQQKKAEKKCWFTYLSRKQTKPRWTSFFTSNRSSAFTCFSKRFANRAWFRMYSCRPTMPYVRNTNHSFNARNRLLNGIP